MTEAVTHPGAAPPEPAGPAVVPLAPFRGWRFAAEAAVYRRAVEQLLTEQAIVGRLQSRPEVTADAVRAAMEAPAAVERVLALGADAHVAVCRALEGRTRTRRRLARARAQIGLEPASVAALLTLIAVLAVPGVYDGVPIGVQLAESGLLLAVGAWLWRRPLARRQLRALPAYSRSRLQLLLLDDSEVDRTLRELATDFTARSARQVLLEVIEALLGEDPHSVLMYDGYQGLRARGDARFFVRSACATQLARKLSLIDGGTIALSGPRGVGKTTLLDAASRLLRHEPPELGTESVPEPDLVIKVAVPAAYTPYDFLLTCLIGVCERYLWQNGQPVPDFSRLSGLVRLRRLAVGRVRRGVRWLLFAVPTAALLVLGTAAAVRGWWGGHGKGLLGPVTEAGHDLVQTVILMWRGQSVLFSLTIVYAGYAVWRLRAPGRLRRLLGVEKEDRAGWVLLWAVGWLVTAVPLVDGLANCYRAFPPLGDLNGSVAEVVPIVVTLGAPPFVFLLVVGSRFPRRLTGGDRSLMGAALSGLSLIALMSAFSITRPIVYDAENPARLGLLMVGLALVAFAAPRRKRRSTQTDLARRCLDQLYRLRTVQGTSAALNLAPGALFGSAHASTLSSMPPNFPQLVAEFRDLVGAIADELTTKSSGGHVFLCIDELDRMGTPEQARTFLGEIKAILGIPRIYCLVSVAEDVSAGFVRRGLPHRDTTDSTFDDVVHVRPMTVTESVAILAERVPGLPRPYAVLAHALSGGIPRDLIRCALGLVELRQSTAYVELPDIALLMLAEELSDTLAGFRTLLAAQSWTPESAPVMVGHRLLAERLDAATPQSADQLIAVLGAFARHPAVGEAALPEGTRSLIAEARSYVAYVLTLLQIFTPTGFDQRSGVVEAGEPDGSAQRLADMRLELAVSPYSALVLIERVRRAWGLPSLSA